MDTRHTDHWFTYHAPTDEDVQAYQALRDEAKRFARLIFELTPRGADQSAAIRKLRECVMTANAAIACKDIDLAPEPDAIVGVNAVGEPRPAFFGFEDHGSEPAPEGSPTPEVQA